MRIRLLALSIMAALGLAGGARADTISLIWQGSGTATTAAASSASITADIVLILTSNVHTVAWSLEWDQDAADELDFVTASSGGGPGTNFSLLGAGDTAGNPGSEGSWSYSNGNGTPLTTGTYTAGTITFHVTSNVSAAGGLDVFPGFFNTPSGDACNGGSCDGRFSFEGAQVIPEPATAALLALGLVSLVAVGRVRSR